MPILKNDIQNKSIEIALHGLTHVKIANGEFGNLNRNEQYRRIAKGKKILDSVFNQTTTTFIPPWNAYDATTLFVMEKLGLNVISSSLCVGQSFSNDNIVYLPHTINNIKKLSSVIDKNKNRNSTIVVMFHAYDFDDSFTLKELNNTLSSVEHRPYVRLVTFKELQDSKELFDKKRMERNLESNLLSKYLNLAGAIQTSSFSLLIRFTNVFIYVIIFLITYLLSYRLLFKNKKSKNNLFLYSIPVLVLVSLGVYYKLLSPIKLIFPIIIVAVLLPFLLKNKS